jgi:hypothetical protein
MLLAARLAASISPICGGNLRFWNKRRNEMGARVGTTADVERFVAEYHAAVAEGYIPVGGHACTGKQTAVAVARAAVGATRNVARRMLAEAQADGLIEDPRRAALRGDVGAPPIPEIAKPPPGFVIKRNAAQYDGDGNLQKQWVATDRDAGDFFDVPEGHVVKGESALVDPQGRVLAKWVKTREGSGPGVAEAFRKVFAEYEGAAPLIPAPAESDDRYLTVYPIPDLHFGMYAWWRETGANYDTAIATAIATDAISSLVSATRPSRRCILLSLGDYFHANDGKAATPASEHRLDVDGRWPRVFAAGAKLMTRLVDIAAQKHEEIEVVALGGNHDPDAAVALTVAISLFYAANPRISVWQEPGAFWYHRFGRVLLGATHGHTMKPVNMAMTLAADRPKDWGETEHRHFFFGHVHHESVKEVGPVRVESFSSPAARDGWTQAGGYRSSRSLSAISFHRDRGEEGRHRINILPPASAV